MIGRVNWWALWLIAGLVFGSLACQANGLAAPPWRGQPGTTFQEWQFSTNGNPAVPEVADNAYGSPSAAIVVGEFGSGWFDQLPGMGSRTGYWDLGSLGTITIGVPNTPNPQTYKEVWIQVTYFRDITQAPMVSVPIGHFVSGSSYVVENVPTGGAWVLDQSIWRIEPNPAFEEIVLTADPMWGAVVDQIVIDTICVPEPASISVLLFGAAAVLGLRRRGNRS